MQNINYAFLLSRPVWGAWIEIPFAAFAAYGGMGRAPYGARGLKCPRIGIHKTGHSRAPYGARGLKFSQFFGLLWAIMSRPVWGAWIEIGKSTLLTKLAYSRAPYGARGLKYTDNPNRRTTDKSRPVWGAWIEILMISNKRSKQESRAPYGARGLKSRYRLYDGSGYRRAPYGARGLK